MKACGFPQLCFSFKQLSQELTRQQKNEVRMNEIVFMS